jgi:hypothetical protein
MADPINQALRVLLNFRLDSAFLGQTHIDFRFAGSFDLDVGLAEAVVGMIGDALLGNDVDGAISSQVTIPLFEVVNLDDPSQESIFVDSEFVGGEAGDPLPPNTAALVSLRTGLSGRSNRGRAYWPGYTEASADGPIFNSTSAGNLASAYFDFAGGIDTIDPGATLAVVSITNAIAHPVTTFFVEPSFATQRNRLGRLR